MKRGNQFPRGKLLFFNQQSTCYWSCLQCIPSGIRPNSCICHMFNILTISGQSCPLSSVRLFIRSPIRPCPFHTSPHLNLPPSALTLFHFIFSPFSVSGGMTFLAGFLDNAAVLGPVLEEQFLEAVCYDQRSFRSE